ncbi:MAG: SpoIIE family protein phosphatase, partial [Verrucomicrobiae bacterium]|nr:SpoIIE family protein phosphatase [Verrucomicrobiae bacterium]
FKRHLESLLSVTQAIGSTFDSEELLRQILSYAMQVTGAERGCILLRSAAGDSLELRVSEGWSEEVSRRPFSYDGYGISLRLIEEVQRETLARIVNAKEPREIGGELAANQVRQAMAVPLRTKEKDLGVLYLDNQLADGVFGEEELELMKSFAIQAAVSIENTSLVQSLVEQDRLKQEMQLGQEIQRGFLPKEAPKVAGLKVAAFMQPAREIGGDYYDFIVRPMCTRNSDERLSNLSAHPERTGGESKGLSTPNENGNHPLAIVVGDVTGKGLGAGLNMAMVKTTLLTLSREPLRPKEILAKANRILHGQMTFGTFISLLYLQWDPVSRAMSYAGAGHCDLVVLRGGRVEIVKSGGAALGLIPEIEGKLEENPLALQPGDKVLLLTDGVLEAQNAAEEQFGWDRLVRSVGRHGREAPDRLIEGVVSDVAEFTAGAAQYDDITVLAIELTGIG